MKKLITLISLLGLIGCTPEVAIETDGSSTIVSNSTILATEALGNSETTSSNQVTTFDEIVTSSTSDDIETGIVMTITAIQDCGDGLIEFPEECDDANNIDDDECSNQCFLPRLVFLSSVSLPSNFGGIKIADNICQKDALRNNLKGIFKAWISDSNSEKSPKFRFESENFKGWYKLPNNTFLANGWNELISENLLNKIDVLSNGEQILSNQEFVWTNTNQDGTAIQNSSCDDWTSVDNSKNVVIGTINSIDSMWTIHSKIECGSKTNRFYCFQVK